MSEGDHTYSYNSHRLDDRDADDDAASDSVYMDAEQDEEPSERGQHAGEGTVLDRGQDEEDMPADRRQDQQDMLSDRGQEQQYMLPDRRQDQQDVFVEAPEFLDFEIDQQNIFNDFPLIEEENALPGTSHLAVIAADEHFENTHNDTIITDFDVHNGDENYDDDPLDIFYICEDCMQREGNPPGNLPSNQDTSDAVTNSNIADSHQAEIQEPAVLSANQIQNEIVVNNLPNNSIQDDNNAVANEITIQLSNHDVTIEDEAEQMLNVLVDYINHHGNGVQVENLLGSVTAQNIEDFLSVYHVQQDSNLSVLANQDQLLPRDGNIVPWQVVREENNNVVQIENQIGIDENQQPQQQQQQQQQQEVAWIRESLDNRAVSIDNQPYRDINNNLVIVIPNDFDNQQQQQQLDRSHDNNNNDTEEEEDRPLVVNDNHPHHHHPHQHAGVVIDQDVLFDDAVSALFGHHGGEEVDLEEFLHGGGGLPPLDLPRLNLHDVADLAFDADSEESSDEPTEQEIIAHLFNILDAADEADAEEANQRELNPQQQQPVVMAAGAAGAAGAGLPLPQQDSDQEVVLMIPEERVVAMDTDDAASSAASSIASSSPRRRERRRKRKRKAEEVYVAPPGDETVGLRWANDLPEIVLVQIYALIRDRDRYSMSRVCKYWSDMFHSARLWRERSFRFAGVYTNIKLGEKALAFARKHSNHLKVLTLTCEHPTCLSVKRFQKTMTSFFHVLLRRHAPCRLHELYMTSLAAERYWRYESTRHKFIKSLCRFLASQRKLTVFDMSDGLFNPEDGYKILEALGRGAGKSVRTLNLEDYFKPRLSLVSCGRWVELLCRFRKLNTLYINYSWLSEPLLLNLSRACGPSLQLLSVKVMRNDPHLHRIDGVTWHTVRKQSPNLRIHLYIEGLGSHGDFRNLLVPEMPLRSLQVWTGLHRSQEGPWHLKHTFNFLADCFTTQLEELSVCCENESESIDESILYLLKKMTRMHFLDLQATLEVTTVDDICQLQQQNKIGLHRCHLILDNLTGVDVQELEYIVDRYTPMITQRKLDFNFQPNQLPFF